MEMATKVIARSLLIEMTVSNSASKDSFLIQKRFLKSAEISCCYIYFYDTSQK